MASATAIRMDQSDPNPAPFQRLDTCATYPYGLGEYLRRLLWNIVQATVFRWSAGRAYRWRRLLLRLFGARMAHGAAVRPSVRIMHPWLLQMDVHAMLGDGVVVYNLGPVSVGQHTIISHESYICAGTHDYTRPDLPLLRPPIRIGAGVWVCAQAFIGPGVTVGDNSVIGARAVVVKDVPAGVVAAGNPARVIKARPMGASAPMGIGQGVSS
jgi:putative colanic acid biosynthesis acetyltransferase WcaF